VLSSFLLLSRSLRNRSIRILLLVFGMAFLDTLGIFSVMPFLAVLSNPDVILNNDYLHSVYVLVNKFGIKDEGHFLVLLGVSSFFLILFSAIYKIYTLYKLNSHVENIRYELSNELLGSYIAQPYQYFLFRNSSEMSKNVLSEIDNLVLNFYRPLFLFAANFLIAFFIISALIIVNYILAITVGFVLGGLYALVIFLNSKKLKSMGYDVVNYNKGRFKSSNEVFNGIKVVKIHGCENEYLQKFDRFSKLYSSIYASYHTLIQVPKHIVEAIAFGGVILIILFFMIAEGVTGNDNIALIIPIVGLYTFSAYRLQPAIQQIFVGISSMIYSASAIQNLSNEISNAPYSNTTDQSVSFASAIELKNVSYSYPGSSSYALRNINLNIPKGSSLGIVGTSGSGKSTLLDLLLGLLHPTEGYVSVDGKFLLKNGPQLDKKKIGYVPQDVFLSDASILENIAFGVPKKDIDYERAIVCADIAHIHDFIVNEMPDGFNSFVGERGIRLSGGERQRIGLARALYHQPDILVFDEATSALDNITEANITNSISKLPESITIITVAHRISTVRNYDNIIYLVDGKILVEGSYQYLIDHSSEFQGLVAPKSVS